MMGGRTYLEEIVVRYGCKIQSIANLPRPVALYPSVLSEDETVQLFTKVLHHVVTLWFTVDKEIQTDLLLEADDSLDFFLDELLIFRIGDCSLIQLSTGSTDLLRLL
jgi:hypothetical protein